MFLKFIHIISFFLKKKNTKFFKLIFLLLLENFTTVLNILAVVPLAEFLIGVNNKSVVSSFFEKFLNVISLQLTFNTILITFLILFFIKSLLGFLIMIFLTELRLNFQKDISSKALKSILFTSWNFISRNNLGKLINSLNNESQKYANLFFQSGLLISMFLRLLALLITPFFLSPKLLISAFIILFILSFPVIFLSKINRKLGEKNTSANNNIQLFFFETFNSLKIIIGINKGLSFLYKYIDLFKKYKSAEINSQILSNGIIFYINFVSVFALIVLLYLNYNSYDNNISILAAIFWSLYNAIPAFSSVLNSVYRINNISPSYDQINSIIKDSSKEIPSDFGKKIKNLNSDIIFKNIYFSYSKNKKIFESLNISFKQRKLNIIFGVSGKGKTTLIDLLLRLLTPDSGEILVNRSDIGRFKISSYRNLFSFLPQEPSLFEGSIRENLSLFCKRRLNNKLIMSVLSDCNLSDLVNEKDDGLDFNIGTKGNKISGGQKQRLALARSLITKPSILVADEPTASLDSQNSLEMVKLLLKTSKKTTVIMITHNKTLLKYAQNIVYL